MKNLDLKIVLKRVGAYMIDIIITICLATLITTIPVFNKKYQKYQDKYQEYTQIYTDYTDIKNLLSSSYEDSEISEEEYNKLLEYNLYKNIFSSYLPFL